MKALLIIDYIHDFVAPDGALTCGEPAQLLDDYIATLAGEFAKAGDYIVVARDMHAADDAYHPESTLFPPHCLAGSKGVDVYGNSGTWLTHASQDKALSRNILWLDKTRYSAFAGTMLDIKLRERGITELHLTGVCSDICVLHTAISAYNLGYKTVVHSRGTASFDAEGHAYALRHMANVLGAQIV